MPRIQILELPTEHHGDDMTTPFILIIDQAPRDEALFQSFREDIELNDSLAARTGARAVLCFEDTIDIPANEAPADGQTYPVTFQVLPDFTEFRAQVAAELKTTQERLATFVRGQVDEQLRLAEQQAAAKRRSSEPTPRPTPEEIDAYMSGDRIPGRQA